MSKSQKGFCCFKKTSKAQGVGGKPTMVRTVDKKYYGGLIQI